MSKQKQAAALLVLCAVSAAATCSLMAQDADNGSGDANTGANQAFVRGWLLPVAGKRDTALTALQTQTQTQLALASSEAGAVSASPSYNTVAEGELSLELKSADETLAQARVALRANRYYTVAAWEDGSKWTLKVFADGSPSPASAERPVRIFNFAGNRETLVSIGQGAEIKVARNSVQEIKSPPKIVMVSVKVLAEDGGPPAQSAVEVDLAVMPSAYVVVGPDYRGRMRPRIVTGGEVKEPEASPDAVTGGQM